MPADKQEMIQHIIALGLFINNKQEILYIDLLDNKCSLKRIDSTVITHLTIEENAAILALTINAPTGSPVDGSKLLFRW